MSGDIQFERIVNVKPAFDKRSDDPSKNYGIGACRITFILKGPHGAVQFMIGTTWYVPSAVEHLRKFGWPDRQYDHPERPDGWDVGYHSPRPMYEGHSAMSGKCDLVPGGECFYDGSGLRADEWVPEFIAGGTEWLWPKLEEEYRYRFFEAVKEAPVQ